MQKILICIAQRQRIAKEAWNAKLIRSAEALTADRKHNILAASIAIADEDVAPAHLLKMEVAKHPNDALLSLWVANPYSLEPALELLRQHGEIQSYIVAEANVLQIKQELGRVSGMCQVAFLKKPSALPRTQWLNAWLGDHTTIAVETQSTFGYRQNIVVSPLPLGELETTWPLMDAIVEENFPDIAMTSCQAFYNAQGDEELFELRQQGMMQSAFRFIDFDAFDCVPMSQYILKPLS